MEHGERQRNEHYGRSSSAFLKTEYITMKKNYHKTLIACYLGFITQAISANFAPLLFLTFHMNLPYFSWKNCVYLDSILFHTTSCRFVLCQICR